MSEIEIDSLITEIKASDDIFHKAKLINHLRKEKKFPLRDIAARLNMKPSYVSHLMRLHRLPELVIDGYLSESIAISHLFIISRLKKDDDMIQLYERVLENNFTVAQTESAVREILYGIKTEGSYLSPSERRDYGENIELEHQTAQITVLQTRIKGRIIIEMKGDLTQTTPFLRNFLGYLKRYKAGK